MSEVQARLVVQRGPQPGSAFVLTQEQVRIGRSVMNDVALSDPEISRQHAQLIRQGEGYAIQDLGSTNGTFVNYQRVVGLTPLKHGDVITLGEAVALAYWEEAATDSQPATPPAIMEQPPATAVPAGPQPPPPTAPLSPETPHIQKVTIPPATPASSPQLPPLTVEDYVVQTIAKRRRRWLLGCGAAIALLLCLCAATFFFLDGYQQGRLLYCGGLRPFWQIILGPFGFSPVC